MEQSCRPTMLTLRIPAFDAAIRKAADPGLRNRPVIIVTSFKPLGRVVAACPIARDAGVAEEMHFPAARARCRDAAFFIPDRHLVSVAMQQLVGQAIRYSPLVESAGGGRILLDTKGTERLWGHGGDDAELLQRDVRSALNLPAAAGLAAKRPWSLLASRVAEVDELCLVQPGDEDAFLHQVPADWVDGITPATRARLLELNIRTVGQLRQFSREEIRRQFGPDCGELLWMVVNPPSWDAISSAAGQLVADSEADAVRVEAAFGEASVEADKARTAVFALAAQAAATLRARDCGAARLRFTLLYADGAIKTADCRTGGYIQDESILIRLSLELLDKVFRRRVRASRLWLAAEKLAEPMRQGVLFSNPQKQPAESGQPAFSAVPAVGYDAAVSAPAGDVKRQRLLIQAMDGIKHKYGDESVRPAVLLANQRERRDRLLAWRRRSNVS